MDYDTSPIEKLSQSNTFVSYLSKKESTTQETGDLLDDLCGRWIVARTKTVSVYGDYKWP